MRLTELKGIGEKTEEAFAKLGIGSVEDLLEFYPRDFEVFSRPTTIAEIGFNTFASVRGAFTEVPTVRRAGKLKLTVGMFRDELGGSIRAVWFNAPYMKDNIRTGQMYVLRGRVTRKRGVLELNQPKIFTPEDYESRMHTMQPVYPLSKGISNNQIKKAVAAAFETQAFDSCCRKECIPKAIRERYGLPGREATIRGMHFPADMEEFRGVLKRAAFEEIFLFILTMKQNQGSGRRLSNFKMPVDSRTEEFLKALPYELTDAQKKVIGEISSDMDSGYVMNRLVQGDVGSGKTIVALAACMNCAFAGGQAAFMAPTEVLAAQHYENITGLFRKYGIDIKVTLLTGSMTATEKKAASEAIEDGRVSIAVGTHALFQEKVRYKNLALVITDEQHRFGIKQREALAGKGSTPHMIVMSATPIPRTLALIIYGDMDVSVIDQLPNNRRPIKNAVVDAGYRPNAYRFIEREVAAGHQAYVICPLVEFSEGIEAANVEDYTELLRDTLNENISIGMLHGQMSSPKKNEIMEKFADGRIQVLVSTTVVEVGVDVPNATVMMVEDANRFGLAALHQLRGRVGRSDSQSYCIFVCTEASDVAKERLDILKSSNNGFEIAAKDLEMRGPGEFLGVRQSGAMAFRNFDVYRDADIAAFAVESVNDILAGRLSLSREESDALEEKTSLQSGGILL